MIRKGSIYLETFTAEHQRLLGALGLEIVEHSSQFLEEGAGCLDPFWIRSYKHFEGLSDPHQVQERRI